jgi:predicted transcriptional regulator
VLKLRLKKLLDEKGITPAKFSRVADIPTTTVYRLINDENYAPTIVTLRKVADYFGLKVDDLYEEVDERKDEK